MFLEDILPSTTPRYKYEGIPQCLRILEQEQERHESARSFNPYLIFFAVDESSFLKCFVNSDKSLITQSWEMYDHSSHNVLVKLSTTSLIEAAATFDSIFSTWARRVQNNLLTATSSSPVSTETRSKRADLSWTPAHPPVGRSSQWPTVIVEASWSERRRKLENDVGFWLNKSNGQVKVVLTIAVHPGGRIDIEKWDLPPVPGSKATPCSTQKIEIVRDPAPNTSKVRGRLDVKFQDVFLREKEGTETDFALSHSDMEEIAMKVWASQLEKI
ncbi:uncharacterized protein N7459_008999 [Penicillium hispanicum]|uniref:uncharacterized protein n=1 Tax=Penicillium hispanicum TaxID=1080232 RepID=UPI0025419811|nr:uncharacterized protein N7459_008999 [Penicillium hispanicum]KAJ5569569.1 hypothetical protein N7459_008999 [Penicillium hispanicum]